MDILGYAALSIMAYFALGIVFYLILFYVVFKRQHRLIVDNVLKGVFTNRGPGFRKLVYFFMICMWLPLFLEMAFKTKN